MHYEACLRGVPNNGLLIFLHSSDIKDKITHKTYRFIEKSPFNRKIVRKLKKSGGYRDFF